MSSLDKVFFVNPVLKNFILLFFYLFFFFFTLDCFVAVKSLYCCRNSRFFSHQILTPTGHLNSFKELVYCEKALFSFIHMFGYTFLLDDT